MAKIRQAIPHHLKQLLQQLGIAVAMLYVTRLIFYFFNIGALQSVGFTDFITALWFDMITVSLFFLPYYTLFLLPINIRENRFYRLFFKVLFHLTNTLLIALNLMDVEYFKYTSKRSTFDLFSLVSTGSDVKQLLTTFLRDFWFLILFLIILIIISEWLYRKTQKTVKQERNFLKANALALIIAMPIFILIGRGGFGLKPVGIIEATKYCKPENTAFILPTAFTMVKTIDQGSLEVIEFFPNEGDTQYFNPIKHSKPQNILPDSTNVMVIMLESFGTEFIGAYTGKEGFTPFFDSIINTSLMFNYAFANGKKSIEAVPAVIASMPTFMDNPYISSPYGDNKINTLPNILKKHGYSSAFYHGATNGSMRFDGFAAICGYDEYFGRYEYDNDDHFDETWGILDEYFNPWTASKMSELKEPFFSTLFTLSSHHPYYIPDHMKDKVKKGPQPICASINYGDYALKRFFEEAKKQDWYNNTLFIILADHTPASNTKLYNQRTHLYRIPIVFYHPSGKLKAEKSNQVFQQMDIMPTILDLINVETDYYAFGNSFYSDSKREALTYLEGTYYYFENEHMTSFSGDKARNLFNFTTQEVESIDSISYFVDQTISVETRIKAIIQRYNRDLIKNQTTINETKN